MTMGHLARTPPWWQAWAKRKGQAMKVDAMVWVQRIMGAVFAVGVVALIGAIVTQVGQAEGLPPLPIFVGLLGIVVLILLSGACLALISLAISARRDSLHEISLATHNLTLFLFSFCSAGHLLPFL